MFNIFYLISIFFIFSDRCVQEMVRSIESTEELLKNDKKNLVHWKVSLKEIFFLKEYLKKSILTLIEKVFCWITS